MTQSKRMSRVIIDLPIYANYGPETIVRGEIVDVAPHLAKLMTFIVGRNPWSPGFRLHNVETGLCISKADAQTKYECLWLAKQRLASISVQKAAARLKQIGAEFKRAERGKRGKP